MEMVAADEIGVGEDVSPPLSPVAYSLHDSFISSHCACCFTPLLNHNQNHQNHQNHKNHQNHQNHHHNHQNHNHHLHLHLHHHHHLVYCSPGCSSSHSPLHVSSGAHLLPSNPPSPSLPSSDLRLALLLLHQIRRHPPPPIQSYHRISGFISNRNILLMSTHHDNDLPTRITNGARAMATARAMAMAATATSTPPIPMIDDEGFLLEEAVLCAVITNAVEVQDMFGRSVGIALYDVSFSWINHSCSPNACYRFLPPPGLQTSAQRCLITPASSSQPIHTSHLPTGSVGGPRIVVRSIKMIKKGEQVTIAYTDLLQPKELRQSDLWSKYRFTCSCHRCLALPPTYVDHCLQKICGPHDYITEYIDDAIHDYLSSNDDAESCCKKLEDALSNHEIRLHPQNHLSLNAYTTLASAYSTASASAMDDQNGLKMKRFSAAYSLLLALLTHDLYLHESSLIASVSNYWVGAGESLTKLAACLASCSGRKCCYSSCGCDLMNMFEGKYEVLEVWKKQVIKCISGMIRGGEVWRFLVGGNGYLEGVEEHMDLRWLKSEAAGDDGGCCVDGRQQVDVDVDVVVVVDVVELGAHCLLYGGILSNISSGPDSHLACYVRQLLSQL